MDFGNTFKCQMCNGDIDGDYQRYYHTIGDIKLEFFTHPGICNDKFRSEYVDPFMDIPIENRFEILDL